MNRRPYSKILDEVANDHIPANLNLAPTIIDRIQKGKGFHMRPRIKLVSAILLSAIAFAILFFTVPDVKAAFERWFGYIPGVGLVHEGQIRVLEEPVTSTRDGVTVTVEQVILNHEQTSLVYSVDGISTDTQTIKPDEAYCSYEVSLKLPDGTSFLASPNGVDAWMTGYRHRFDFATIPANIDNAALEISCLFHTRPGSAPEGWEIPLHFVDAPADMTVLPVIDMYTPEGISENAPDHDSKQDALSAEAVTLTIDRAVSMDGGYLIYSTLHWEETAFGEIDLIDISETLHLLDANGQEIPYEIFTDDQTGIKYDQHQTAFAIKTSPVQSDTLTLVVDALLVNLPVEALQFEFDPGANPKPGQKWQPDLELNFGKYRMKVDTITFEEAGGYSFEMSSDTGVRKASPVDVDHPIVTGYEGESTDNLFFSGFYYAEGLPVGPVTFTISSIWVKQPVQQMQVEWTLPEGSAGVSAEALPIQAALCLTPEKWQASLNHTPAIPAGLPDKVFMYGPVDPANPNGAWETSIVNLDGSQRKSVSTEKGTISPDGVLLAFQAADAGIMIKNLSTEETVLLQGTAAGDSDPFWSQDGKKVVFMRNIGIFDLFSVNLDGTDLRQLTFGGSQEIPLAWLADGSLLYEVLDINGTNVYRLDLESDKSQLFSSEGIQSVSQDGQYLAITKMANGERWQIAIKETTGNQRWDLTDGNMSVLNPLWSPDGQWIMTTVLNPEGPAMGALINLSTCDVIPLPNLQDDILVWVP